MNIPAEKFVSTYITEYEQAGYTPVPGGDLCIQNGSTIFASCTISNYRDALLGNAWEPGSVMVQRCFRTQTMDELHLPTRHPRRALFDMYGGFESATADTVSEKLACHTRIIKSVLEQSGVDASDIVLMGNSYDLERWQLDAVTDNSVPIESYDNELPASQKPRRAGKVVKQYGDGVTGHGLEVFVRQPDTSWRLSGNIVETLTAGNQTSGVDFGGGLEAGMQAIYGPSGAYLDAELGQRFGIEVDDQPSPRMLNMLEALESLMIILSHEPKRHPLSSTGHAVEMSTRAVSIQAAHLGIDMSTVHALARAHQGGEVPDPTRSADKAVGLAVGRRSAVEAVARTAMSGPIGTCLRHRQNQATRQNHTFDAPAAAKLIVANIHKLSPASKSIVPNGLLTEELVLSGEIAI
jgi:hypothetical protein